VGDGAGHAAQALVLEGLLPVTLELQALALDLLLGGDVAGNAAEGEGPAGAVMDQLHPGIQDDRCAVGGVVGHFPSPLALRQGLAEDLRLGGPQGRIVTVQGDRLADDLLAGEFQQAAFCLVDVGDAALEVGDGHQILDLVEDQRQYPQLLLDLPVLRAALAAGRWSFGFGHEQPPAARSSARSVRDEQEEFPRHPRLTCTAA